MLHILTSDAILARPDFLPIAESLLYTIGQNGALHLRCRTLTGNSYATLAKRLTAVSRATGATLVINGRPDIALAAGAPAVQLGRDALSIADVRHIAPALRIGVSIHSIEEAKAVAPEVPDWVIAGHIYPTTTHQGIPGRGLHFLESVVQTVRVPVIAVGGIRAEHLPEILSRGAVGVAVVSGIWDENDPDGAAMRYLWEDDSRRRTYHHPQC